MKKRLFSAFLALVMVLMLVPVTAMADGYGSNDYGESHADKARDIVNITTGSEDGEVWYAGNMYVINGDVSFTNSDAGGNGITLAKANDSKNNVVIIYVPAGKTLTATGTNGSDGSSKTDATNVAGQGGGAGIYVPAEIELIIVGAGTVTATGGNGGKAADGRNAGYYADGGYYGGAGGYGAGGSGAGIGTSGANGHTTHGGSNSSAPAGNVYIFGTMQVTAKPGTAGGAGSNKGSNYANGDPSVTYAYGGGKGGAGSIGANIGNGGYGGPSGAAGTVAGVENAGAGADGNVPASTGTNQVKSITVSEEFGAVDSYNTFTANTGLYTGNISGKHPALEHDIRLDFMVDEIADRTSVQYFYRSTYDSTETKEEVLFGAKQNPGYTLLGWYADPQIDTDTQILHPLGYLFNNIDQKTNTVITKTTTEGMLDQNCVTAADNTEYFAKNNLWYALKDITLYARWADNSNYFDTTSKPNYPVSNAKWYNSYNTSGNDGTSAVTFDGKNNYQLCMTETGTYTDVLTSAGEGNPYVEQFFVKNSTNQTSIYVSTVEYYRDVTLPVVTELKATQINEEGLPITDAAYVAGDNNVYPWTNESVEISFKAGDDIPAGLTEDDISGLAKVEYRRQGIDVLWQPAKMTNTTDRIYTIPRILETCGPDGITYEIRAMDNAGNYSEVKEITVKIDKTMPTLAIEADKVYTATDPDTVYDYRFGDWTNANKVVITVTADDDCGKDVLPHTNGEEDHDQSGVREVKVEYSIDNGKTWKNDAVVTDSGTNKWTTTLENETCGDNVVYRFTVTDVAGNVKTYGFKNDTDEGFYTVKIDRTAPAMNAVTATAGGKAYTGEDVTSSSVTLNLSATDLCGIVHEEGTVAHEQSEIAYFMYRVKGSEGAWSQVDAENGAAQLTFNRTMNTTYEFKAVDNAGNVSANTVEFTVKISKPTYSRPTSTTTPSAPVEEENPNTGAEASLGLAAVLGAIAK